MLDPPSLQAQHSRFKGPKPHLAHCGVTRFTKLPPVDLNSMLHNWYKTHSASSCTTAGQGIHKPS